MEIHYLGGSGFCVRTGAGAVAIDPYWGGLQREVRAMPRGWPGDVDAVALSHGHYDHALSAADVLARHPSAVVVGDDALTAHPTIGAPPDRRGGTAWRSGGLNVDLLAGAHFEEAHGDQLRRVLRWGARRPASLLRMLDQIGRAPPEGPTHAVRVAADGLVALHAAEVLHDRAAPAALRAWLQGERLDVLMAGVEPGHEPAVVRAVDTLRPLHVVLFSPHRWLRRWFEGHDPLDLGPLARTLRALPFWPSVVELQPQEGVELEHPFP